MNYLIDWFFLNLLFIYLIYNGNLMSWRATQCFKNAFKLYLQMKIYFSLPYGLALLASNKTRN